MRREPSLEELLAEPAKAFEVSPETAIKLLAMMSPVQQNLLVAVTSAQRAARPADAYGPFGDVLLDVNQAAPRLGIKPKTLYDHADDYPFTVRKGRSVRFSSKGIDDYIRDNSGG
jgi:predicted DNA-binding transcriptional regulator AlpA